MISATHGLEAHVLVLNRQFQPVSITQARRAFHLLATGAARALDKNLQSFDFASWAGLSADLHDEHIRTATLCLGIPRVVLLQLYDRMPNQPIRLNRQNVYLRDAFVCQYCHLQFEREQLNLDHVIPRSQGGQTSWDNIVCCCVPCNLKKGGRTPGQAKMRLLKNPKRPQWWESFSGEYWHKHGTRVPYREWLPFIDSASASYWHVELDR